MEVVVRRRRLSRPCPSHSPRPPLPLLPSLFLLGFCLCVGVAAAAAPAFVCNDDDAAQPQPQPQAPSPRPSCCALRAQRRDSCRMCSQLLQALECAATTTRHLKTERTRLTCDKRPGRQGGAGSPSPRSILPGIDARHVQRKLSAVPIAPRIETHTRLLRRGEQEVLGPPWPVHRAAAGSGVPRRPAALPSPPAVPPSWPCAALPRTMLRQSWPAARQSWPSSAPAPSPPRVPLVHLGVFALAGPCSAELRRPPPTCLIPPQPEASPCDAGLAAVLPHPSPVACCLPSSPTAQSPSSAIGVSRSLARSRGPRPFVGLLTALHLGPRDSCCPWGCRPRACPSVPAAPAVPAVPGAAIQEPASPVHG